MDQRRLVFGVLAVVIVLYFVQDRVRDALHKRAEDSMARSGTVALGSTKPAESIDDIEAISRIMDEVSKTYVPGATIAKEHADRLEAFMQPDRPVPTRMRAMKAGQVIGQERFKKVLLQAWKDPDPRVRRTAVGKADTVPDLRPEDVPSLADDPDPGVRSAWEMWTATVKSRGR